MCIHTHSLRNAVELLFFSTFEVENLHIRKSLYQEMTAHHQLLLHAITLALTHALKITVGR